MDGELADGGVQRAEEGFPADGALRGGCCSPAAIPPCIPKSNWRTARSGITWSAIRSRFRNFGEGFELAGVDEGKDLEPTGARFLTNIPMPDPLYRNTSREYPGFNMNVPDQFRATQFIKEMEDDGAAAIRLHPPAQRPHGRRRGRPTAIRIDESFVADNDYALGRIVEYLSGSARNGARRPSS